MGTIATRRLSGGWRTALKLGRVSNLPTVWSNVIAGTALSGGAPVEVVVTVAGAISLLYVGGMFLNDAYDARTDAIERPERPIPSGEISVGAVFAAGGAFLVAGAILLATINLEAGTAGLALVGSILLYDRFHKNNPASPFVMGLCRALVYVAAAAAATAAVSMPVLLASAATLAYVAGLTFTARLESIDKLGSAWPLVLLAAPVALAASQIEATPAAALAFAALFAGAFLAARLLMRRAAGDVGRAVALLIACIAANDALLAATTGDFNAPYACLACFLLTLALQRYVPAT